MIPSVLETHAVLPEFHDMSRRVFIKSTFVYDRMAVPSSDGVTKVCCAFVVVLSDVVLQL